MMFSELDFRSHTPIYVQLVERIKHLIATGVLEPEGQLPTVRQLAAELRVNFNTVARAYRILDEAGVISTQQGRGTYVLDPPPPEQAERLRRTALAGLTASFLDEASRMGFNPRDVQESTAEMIKAWLEEGHPTTADE